MKKIIALMLSVLMACSVMTACDDKKDDDDKDTKTSSAAPADDESKADESKEDAGTDGDESKEDPTGGDESKDDDPEKPNASGNGGDATADAPMGETVGEDVDPDPAPFEALTSIADAKEMTLDLTMSTEIEGMTLEIPLVISTDGTNSYIKMNMIFMEIEALVLDGKTYMIDSTNKVYYVDESGSVDVNDITGDMDLDEVTGFDTDSIKGCKKVTVSGTDYTRYELDSDGQTMYAYVRDGALKFMAYTVDGENAVITFNEISNSVNPDLLKLPEGYEEVTMEEYQELLLGGMDFDF